MRFDDNGLLHYSDDDIRDASTKALDRWYAQAARDWVERQWTPPKAGDWFDKRDEKYVLAQTSYHQLQLVSLHDGNRWTKKVEVKDPYCLTKEEWEILSGTQGGFTPVDKAG